MKSVMRRAASATLILVGLCGCGIVAAVLIALLNRPTPRPQALDAEPPVKLVSAPNAAMQLSPGVVAALGIKTSRVETAPKHERLNLSGSLFLDANRMVRVHGRFGGEVVSVGLVVADGTPAPLNSPPPGARPLRLGDHVTKGQLVAVIWSKDVGEKKSDLVNSLSQLYLDKAQLERLQKLPKGVVPEKLVHEAERTYEGDMIEVERVERTLRSWRLTEDEIQEVRDEAARIHQDLNRSRAGDKHWAEVDVYAPFDGVILEKNITVGDIVDTSLDLFKIADLTTLGVLANVFEEDLPALEALPKSERKWTVKLKSQPKSEGYPGTFEVIGNIVDPSQHTLAVMGYLANPKGHLRVGQFITTTVELPASSNEVMIPDGALVEAGSGRNVFVASDVEGCQVTRRKVAVVDRSDGKVYIHERPTAAERASGCEELRPGEWVISAGSIELAGALENALAAAPSDAEAH